jgi:hypothetical protein
VGVCRQQCDVTLRSYTALLTTGKLVLMAKSPAACLPSQICSIRSYMARRSTMSQRSDRGVSFQGYLSQTHCGTTRKATSAAPAARQPLQSMESAHGSQSSALSSCALSQQPQLNHAPDLRSSENRKPQYFSGRGRKHRHSPQSTSSTVACCSLLRENVDL